MEGFNKFLAQCKTFFESGLGVAVLFIITAILGFIVIKLILKLLKRLEKKTRIDNTICKFIYAVAKFALYMLYIITLLAIIGVPITSLVAIFTALTLGFTLALQNSVSNIVNGVILMANKPYKIGDSVQIDTVTGTVVDINIFNTKLKTPNNEVITIPHNITLANPIIDLSAMDKRRVSITIGVSYNTDIYLVKNLITDILKNNVLVLHEEENSVNLSLMNSSSLDFSVKAWTKTDTYWDCLYSLNEQIFTALNENGIEIPYQQIDIHMRNEENNLENSIKKLQEPKGLTKDKAKHITEDMKKDIESKNESSKIKPKKVNKKE